MTFWKKLAGDRKGATAVEYGLIVALIAIAAISALSSTGSTLSNTMNTVSDGMSGS